MTGPELVLPNGERVSAGDTVITKRNKRIAVDGRHRLRPEQLPVDRQQGQRRTGRCWPTEITRGVTRVLPAWYVTAGFLRLGYAYTHASVQGMTVGTAHTRKGTAHTVVTDRMTRQDLYPAMTRATDGTHAYVDPRRRGRPARGDHTRRHPTADGDRGAHRGDRPGRRRPVRDHRDPRRPRPGVAARARRRRLRPRPHRRRHDRPRPGPGRRRSPPARSRRCPGSPTAPAWETLLGHLAVLALDGHDPIARLADAAAERELDTARDLAAVLDYRLDPTGNHSQRPGPLPWVPDIPETLDPDPGVGNVSRRPRPAGHRPGHRTRRAGAGGGPGWTPPGGRSRTC